MDFSQLVPRVEQQTLPQALISPQVTENEDFEIIDRASLESPANESAGKSVLSASGSKSLHRDMIGALTTPMSDALHVPLSPPRKGTPIPTTFQHAVLSDPTLTFDEVRLPTPSPRTAEVPGTIDLSAEPNTGEVLESSAEPVLGKAYSTVIASTNRPIGHRSSSSLRHIVFSRTTSASGSVSSPKQDPEDLHSSTDSFVKVTRHEGDPKADGADVLCSPSYNERAISLSNSFANDSDIRATDVKEPVTLGWGRQTHKKPISSTAAVPLQCPNSVFTSPLPETSTLSPETLSAVPSPLSFLASLPDSTPHSARESLIDLSRSYDPALDPNNLKYWWDAGVRDGDPVGTPSSRDSPPSRHQEHGCAGARHGESSEQHADQAPPLPSHTFAESHTQYDIETVTKSDSDESVEQGREVPPSLSNAVLSRRRTAGGQAMLKIAEGDEEKGEGEDATGGSLSWLEPLDVLLQDTPDPDSKTQGLHTPTTSRYCLKDEPPSIRSLPSNAASSIDVGILSPEKQEMEEVPVPSMEASVDPLDLHISPQQLPYHPITSYIAKFAMIPETDLRRLFSNELSYAVVSDYHLTHHELFLWYKQIFRTTQPSSGNFQTVICALIQIGLEHAVQPMDYTLQKLQSNPNIICLLPPGGCAVHDQPEDDHEFGAQSRPQTSHGNHHTSQSRDMRGGKSKEIVVELDIFAYDIKEDLDLSSSSESGSRLSFDHVADAACTRPSASDSQNDSNTNNCNLGRFHSASGENERSNEAKITGFKRDKGKSRARMDLDIESQEPDNARGDASSTMHVIPVRNSLGPTISSVEKSIIAELMFSDSKWNVFNRVLGLLSHSLQVPWNEVLESPRCVYSLVHDAGVSVENFQKWVISAEGEEKAEQEQAKVEPSYHPWRAATDIEGRWNGESLLAAMFAILPMKQTFTQVSQLAPFQRALLYLVRVCDRNLERLPIEETYAFLRNYNHFLHLEPWSIPSATRAVIRNLRTHLESPSGNYLAPEARDELKEFVRVQELQIGSSSKDWQGDEAMDFLQTAQLMIG